MAKKIKNKIKPKRVKTNNSFDVKKIKKLIKNDLYSHYIKKDEAMKTLNPFYYQNTAEEEEKEYYNRYTEYMAEQFNSTIVHMIIIYINKSKDFPEEYKTEVFFMNKIVNLIKHLLMNEIELACFTILLDEMGWKHPTIDHWTYFSILGIFSKKICGHEEESSLLNNIFERKNNEFIDYYTSVCDEEKINNVVEEKLTVKLMNDRYKKLTKSINSYCRKNFINYNGIVDKIVKWSQPYGDQSNGNELYNDEQLNLNKNKKNINNNKDSNKDNNKDNNLLFDFKEEYISPFHTEQNKTNNIINNNSYNLLPPIISSAFNDQGKFSINNNSYINKYIVPDINNQNMYLPNSLNLVKGNSSRLSLKSDNNSIFN